MNKDKSRLEAVKYNGEKRNRMQGIGNSESYLVNTKGLRMG